MSDRPASCVLCGAPLARSLFIIGPNRFLECRSCGLVQMNPLRVPEELGEDYEGFDLESYAKFMIEFPPPQYERDWPSSAVAPRAAGCSTSGCGMGDSSTSPSRPGSGPTASSPRGAPRTIAGDGILSSAASSAR